MGSERPQRGPSYYLKFAKAETLLVLALISDLVINPWLYSHPALPSAGKTLIKMGFFVGLFGPVQSLITQAIDGTLKATRTVTSSVFSVPKMGIHALILSGLFVSFNWSMYQQLPWYELYSRSNRQASVERR